MRTHEKYATTQAEHLRFGCIVPAGVANDVKGSRRNHNDRHDDVCGGECDLRCVALIVSARSDRRVIDGEVMGGTRVQSCAVSRRSGMGQKDVL
jgi:hypothetical protein